VVDPSAPQDIVALADERASARSLRDYRTADELKARIEAAGWKVVDFGSAYELKPARPADVTEGERTLYGGVASVPSRLDQPTACPASVVVVANGDTAPPEQALRAIADTVPPDTQVLLVAGPDTSTDGPADEVVATAVAFGAGDALQAGLRRTTGAIVIVLEPEHVPGGDIVTPIVAALADPSVAIVASTGLHSADLHRYRPLERGDATTVASGCYGFRRADAIDRGPIDDRLQLRGSVAAWLGLLLRDEGPQTTPRRAQVLDLPLELIESGASVAQEHARLARRDGYRIADRFRGHQWLAGGEEPPQGRLVGDGPDDGQTDDDGHKRAHAEDA
jgi:hypothetical protein